VVPASDILTDEFEWRAVADRIPDNPAALNPTERQE
jgi:hypothetical protein